MPLNESFDPFMIVVFLVFFFAISTVIKLRL
jgi:hypothetical protein